MKSDFKNTTRGGLVYTATMLLFMAVTLIGQYALNALNAAEKTRYAIGSLFPVLSFAAVWVFYTKKFGKPRLLRVGSAIYVAPSLLLAFGMLFGLGFVNFLIRDAVIGLGGVVSETDFTFETPLDFIVFTVVLCVLPAVFEELFFRGLLLSALNKTGKVAAVTTVALCFAAYHANVSQLAYQFLYGVGLGILSLKSESVFPAVLAHFINNFTLILFGYIGVADSVFFSPIAIAAGGLSLLAFALFTAFYGKQTKGGNAIRKEKGEESIKDFYFPFGIIGILFAALLIIIAVIPFSA